MSRMKKEEYLKILTDQIRCKAARAQITEEVQGHIEEQEALFLSEGLEREEAEAEAVREMGDPVEAGTALDLIHRPRMAWGWILLIAALYAAGYAILNLLQQNFSEVQFVAGDYIKWLLMGMLVMIGVCYADYSRIGRWAKEITIVGFVIIFAGIWLFGEQVNGVLQWIWLPFLPFTLNVRLLCYLFVPLYAGIVYHYHGKGYEAIVKCFLWMLPALCIAVKIRSSITGVMIFLIFLLILSFAVFEGWFAVSAVKMLVSVWGGTALLAGIGYFKLFIAGPSYQFERIRALLGNGEVGYQVQILRGVLDGCRFIGSGEGKEAVRAADGLMEGMDYGLMYIMVSYGILAAVLVIGLVVGVFIYFMNMSVSQRNRLGSIMGFGCTAAFFVQILFYVMVNMGVVPLGNMYCPFLTYGGTGVLVTNVLLGILLNIYRYQDIPLETEKGKTFKIMLN